MAPSLVPGSPSFGTMPAALRGPNVMSCSGETRYGLRPIAKSGREAAWSTGRSNQLFYTDTI